MPYLILALAVLAETIGTAALQASQQFTRPLPSVVVAVSYAAAFYLLSMVLKVTSNFRGGAEIRKLFNVKTE